MQRPNSNGPRAHPSKLSSAPPADDPVHKDIRTMRRKIRERTSPPDNDDDEDEETLQLRLQALEARLKLKKLQQKKGKKPSNSSDIENERPGRSANSSVSAGRSTAEGQGLKKSETSVRNPTEPRPVQVPVSPQRKAITKEAPKSPGRVLLGIDKGLKGKNVSLRSAPERKSSQELDDPFLEFAVNSRSRGQQSGPPRLCLDQHNSTSRPMTFSERIADTRQRDKEQQARLSRLGTQRSIGFGIKKEDLKSLSDTAEEEAKATAACSDRTTAKPTFSREEVLRAASKPNGGLLQRNTSTSANQAVRRKNFENPNASPGFTKPTERPEKAPSPTVTETRTHATSSKKPSPTDASLFEPFCSIHLSKRLIPHDSLTKALTGRSILLLPDLLKTVKAPEYSLPDDLEADYVILAIVASKSSPLAHKDRKQQLGTAKAPPSSTDIPTSSLSEAAESEANERGKYMAFTLTDLKWSLDLYLFTSAYTRWRKLAPGTVIAILNPNIMPPPPHNPHNNRFSLTLNSNEDTILEVGTSRDLSWCSSMKKDGKQCDAWIDKRHTSVCEYHVDRVVEQTRRGRMEVNGISSGFAPGGKKGSRSGYWGTGGGGGKRDVNSKSYPAGFFEGKESGRKSNLLHEGAQYDRSSQTRFFVGGRVPTGFGQSAASLLDADGLADRGGREERVRKRMAEREREKEIAKQLGEKGQGMGGEYLKMREEAPNGSEATQSAGAGREMLDAKALGLKGNKAGNVQLSPVKKRRIGGALEDGPRKKTRFVTERGIKEAGRESLGVIGLEEKEEGDDELDIV
ncbi:MAG: hypothetical protein Q9170_001019 [Blastenia crenularia]